MNDRSMPIAIFHSRPPLGRTLGRYFPGFQIGLVVIFLGSFAQEPRALGQHGHALGKVDFPVTCTARAQGQFNRAVALLHHMSYPQARAAFKRVVVIDSRCAMAHWGIAMTLFQPLWPTRPGPEALKSGCAAVRVAE